MEEEIVISSWQQSDFPKDANGSFSRTINRSSKENIDMNAWLSQQDSENTRTSQPKTEDEIILDDESLSRLIEGDLKSDEEHESFDRSRKPKPKPRHDMRFSNTESLPIKDSADKLFSGVKDSADKLFSGAKESADKLFSGEKRDRKNDDSMTSPRPVPRPRSKPVSKENSSHEHSSQKMKFQNETSDSRKLSADKLFDSVGKGNKSVSFVADVDANKDSTTKKVSQKMHVMDKNSRNERTPPIKAPRSRQNSKSPRKGKSSDESDSEQNLLRSSEHKRHPQPQQRREDRMFLESNSLTTGYNSESHWTPDGINELFDTSRQTNSRDIQHQRNFDGDVSLNGNAPSGLKQRRHDMPEGRVKEERGSRWDTKEHENDGSRSARGLSKGKHEKLQNGSFRKGHDRKGNITDMFEDHVPASNEIVLGGEDNKTEQRSRQSGNENKVRSPMKAHKGLNEMTKSPDMYNFKYESRDLPQDDTFSRSIKGNLSSSQRSFSLTDLNSWKSAQFEDYQDEESLDSSRSGFSSSRGIRDAVYAEWLKKKQGKLKEAVRKKLEEKRKEEEKIKEKQEKEVLAKKAFEAWSSKKEDVIKTEIKKKKDIKEKDLDEKREKIAKKQEAKKYFESWKGKKDEVLKESYQEKREKEREVKQKKIDDHKEKIEIAKKAYDKWKSRKDEQLKEEIRSTRQAGKLKTRYEKEAEMEKRQESERTFQEFLRKKGTGKRAPPSPSLTQRAWCPGGLTKGTNLIPEKVEPVIAPPRLSRSRSFTGPTRTMTSFNTTKRLGRGW